MSTQSRKHTLGLAGEFLVAGELLRRGIGAAVTYGNAKKADVIAVHEDKALTIEVKSTSQTKWVLGNHLPPSDKRIWVLVHLPSDLDQAPSYHVLSGKELHEILLPKHKGYLGNYLEKHGEPFTGTGVFSITQTELTQKHIGAWHKVSKAVGL